MAALINMLLSITIYAVYPLVGYFSSGVINPLFLIPAALLFTTVVKWIVLPLLFKSYNVNFFSSLKTVWQDKTTLGLSIADGLLNFMGHTCLIASFTYINKYAASLLYDSWPILAVFLIPLIAKQKGKVTLKDGLFGIISFIGLWFILNAQAPQAVALVPTPSQLGNMAIPGIMLSVAALTAMGISATLIVRLEQEIQRLFINNKKESSFPSILAPITASASSSMFGLVFAWTTWFLIYPGSPVKSGSSHLIIALIIVSASLVTTFGSFFYVNANRLAQFSGINLVSNFTPVISLGLLFLAGQHASIPSQVFLGGMFVLAANMATSIRIAFSNAYYAVLVAICISAAFCFFNSPNGLPTTQYFIEVGVLVSIFLIFVLFITQQVSQQHRIISNELLQNNVSHNKNLSIIDYLASQIQKIPKFRMIAMKLVESKQNIIAFSEFFVLWIIGGITIAIAIFGRPINTSETFVINMLPVIVTAGVVFISFSMIDLKNKPETHFLTQLLESHFGYKQIVQLFSKKGKSFSFLVWTATLFALVLLGMYAFIISYS